MLMRVKTVFHLFAWSVAVAGALVASRAAGADAKTPLEAARAEFLNRSHPRSSTPGDVAFLRILVEASQAKRGVEVGSSVGFGAIAMGLGFERTGGRLTTIEIDPKTAETCRHNIARLGLEKTVQVVEGDALKVLPTLEGAVDFVYLDAIKRDSMKYFRALEPRLKKGALVIADNAIQSAREMQDFLDFMHRNADYQVAIVRASSDKGDGMAICLKLR